jgi:hypothetical protein
MHLVQVTVQLAVPKGGQALPGCVHLRPHLIPTRERAIDEVHT